MLTQMSAKGSINKFGEYAVLFIFKEFEQLKNGAMPGKPVFRTINPDVITTRKIKGAREAANFIKHKRSGNIKVRTCAYGSKKSDL